MKMLRSRKHFARCSVPGHGQRCILTQEIRAKPISRSTEKRQWKKELDAEN